MDDEEKEKQKIRDLKNSCVPLGISIDDNPKPYMIGGTGFIIDPEGYVLTATHVIRELENQANVFKRQKRKCAICAYRIEVQNGNVMIKARGLVERRHLEIKPTPKFPAATNYDAMLCRMMGNENYPFLKIKKPTKLEINEEIRVCGYPGGKGTLNFDDFETGIRLSPLFQTGRIAGIMPIDDVVNPTGIITDIFGTGGSSGSPIVEKKTNEVIGIAQRVLSTNVVSLFKQDLIGTAHIGLIFGISNYGLSGPIDFLLKQMKKELDENGQLKKEYKEKYEKDDSDYISFHVDKPEEIIENKKEDYAK